MCKPLFCTEFVESKNKKTEKSVKETLKYSKQIECFTGLALISTPSTLANLYLKHLAHCLGWREMFLCVRPPGFKIYLYQHQLVLVVHWSHIGKDPTKFSNTLEKYF